jgi:hypothetical protein
MAKQRNSTFISVLHLEVTVRPPTRGKRFKQEKDFKQRTCVKQNINNMYWISWTLLQTAAHFVRFWQAFYLIQNNFEREPIDELLLDMSSHTYPPLSPSLTDLLPGPDELRGLAHIINILFDTFSLFEIFFLFKPFTPCWRPHCDFEMKNRNKSAVPLNRTKWAAVCNNVQLIQYINTYMR